MPTDDFYLGCLVILIAAGTMTTTVYLLERWLLKEDKPRLRRALRVRRIRRAKYEPPDPKGRRTYPNGKEEAL